MLGCVAVVHGLDVEDADIRINTWLWLLNVCAFVVHFGELWFRWDAFCELFIHEEQARSQLGDMRRISKPDLTSMSK